jgi:hypothetical protein
MKYLLRDATNIFSIKNVGKFDSLNDAKKAAVEMHPDTQYHFGVDKTGNADIIFFNADMPIYSIDMEK